MVMLLTRKSLFIGVIAVFFFSFLLVPFVHAQGITFHIEKQWIKIWMNKDGTIDLFYNLTLVCDSGIIHHVRIGQPNKDFNVSSCKDQQGQNLQTEKITNDWSGVKCNLADSLTMGEKVTIILTTRVDKMIWEDETNPGNVGMLFTACWWEVTVPNLRIAVVLPENVRKNETLSGKIAWNSIFQDPEEGGKWVVYWERSNLPPNEKFTVGVSFPQKYVDKWYSKSWWDKVVETSGPLVFLLGIMAVIGIPVVIVGFVMIRSQERRTYAKPRLTMEALGVRKGLTAVEAATLLRIKPTRILTMILFGLMKKGVIKVVKTKPHLRLRVLKDKLSGFFLHSYENSFLDAIIRSDHEGPLKDKKLRSLIIRLRIDVDDKVKYYCRADTIKFYQKIVDKAWKQVREAKTPEVKADVFNENLEWLMADPRFRRRTKLTFGRREVIPSQSSWWLPYWTTHYSPRKLRVGAPGKPATPPTLPGSQFASAIVTTVESTANRIVSNIEAFSKSLIPAPPPAQAQASEAPPVSRGGCVCACASCACACACASCACACASGGVG